MSIVHDHRPYPDDDPVCTPVVGLEGAFRYLGMDEETAHRAVQILHGIVTDPIAADFHQVVEQDTTRIFEGVQCLSSNLAAPKFSDGVLDALFARGSSLNSVARDLGLLLARLPGIAQWYEDSDEPQEAQLVQGLYRDLIHLTQWI